MQNDKNDFKYAKDFLDRINRSKIGSEPLSEKFIVEGYNIWHFYQTSIFFSILKIKTSGTPELSKEKTLKNSFKEWMVIIFSIVISFLVILKLLIKKPLVMIFSIDRTSSKIAKNDQRIDPIYKPLVKNKFLYFEIFHAVLDKEIITRFFKRRRLAIYDSAIDGLYRFKNIFGTYSDSEVSLNLQLFSEKEKSLAEFIINKHLLNIARSLYRVRIYSFILKLSKPRAIFSIDDPRDYSELVLAAKLKKIPIIAIQHGHFTKYHVGWLLDPIFKGQIAHPDKLLVWSEYWKKELLRMGTYFLPEEIIVGGIKNKSFVNLSRLVKNETTILVPYEVDSNKTEIKKYIDSFLEKNYIVIFKLRKDFSEEIQLKESNLTSKYHKNLIIISNTEEALSKCHIVAGSYSTFLYEAIEALKPIVYLETGSDFGEGIFKNNLAFYLANTNDVEKIINEALKIEPSELQERKEILIGKNPQDLYESIDVLLKEVHHKNNV